MIDFSGPPVGMDKGSECMGAGKGKKWATLRAALMGKGGPLEEIFGTRWAVHAVLDGEHGPLLDRAMQFLGADDRRNMFPVRPFPERPDTSKPVMSLPCKLKILVRRIDASTKRKVVISSEDAVVESRISTAQSMLRVYSLVEMFPDRNYCDKHMIDRGAVAWTQVVKQPLGNIEVHQRNPKNEKTLETETQLGESCESERQEWLRAVPAREGCRSARARAP
jgi:hypothetical protein